MTENPFLKLLTISKKEKQLTKSKTFNEKIINTGLTISKSSLRRRKRKLKESLKPKMSDILDSLPTVETEPKFVETVAHSNEPNFRNKTGQQVIFKQEHQNFNRILQDRQFRTSPFATLKEAIKNNMNK